MIEMENCCDIIPGETKLERTSCCEIQLLSNARNEERLVQ